MAVPVPVSVSTDFAFGGSLHLYLPIPFVPVAPVPMPASELPLPLAWPPGVAMGSVKKTSTVLVNGKCAIQTGHDCGKLMPQITIPPNNLLLPLHLVSSSRETIVKCFSVRMDKAQVACTTAWLPLLSCGQPVSVPLTFTPTNIMRGVFVGASAADFVGALVSTLVRMAVEKLLFPIGKLGVFGELGKGLLGALAGGYGSVVQHLMDPRYPITVDVKVKAAGLEFGVGVSCASSDTKNNPSQVTVKVEKKWNPEEGQVAGGKAGASVTVTWDAGGDTTKEGVAAEVGVQGGVGFAGGKASASAEYHPDAPGGGDQFKGAVAVKADVPGNSASGSAGVEMQPGAPADGQVKGTVTGKVDTPASSSTGTASTSGALPKPSAVGWPEPVRLPAGPKDAGWQPPQSGAGIWGPPL